jgi:hypothetical protein
MEIHEENGHKIINSDVFDGLDLIPNGRAI